MDGVGQPSFDYRQKKGYMAEVMIGLMSTPAAQDGKNATFPESQMKRNSVIGQLMKGGASGRLNPQFVMEMMGFPPNWTELPFQSGLQKASKQEETP